VRPVDGGYIGVEGGDVACVSGVEEERVRWSLSVGAVDDEVAVPESCVCLERVSS
jgi:hypothetical protein